jgi:uncharacterized membrane-anchored protein
MTRRALFYVVILLQALFLLIMTASFYAIDMFGQQIKLKTEPIDPRDIFYGDYVILQYAITTIPKNLWLDSTEPENGDQVYVVLAQKGDYYEAISVSDKNPELGANEVVLKGRYLYDFGEQEMYIEYGIERYFVPEGTGRELEENRGNMEAYIRIAPWGQMKIEKVNALDE